MKTTHIKSNSGFTLIEILAATSILVMLMLAATSMLMTTVLSQARGSIRAQVKGEGSAIMQRIAYNLRNASEITSACTGADSSTISYKNIGSEIIYTFKEVSGTITLEDDSGSDPIVLHTGVVVPSELNLNCENDVGTGSKFITIGFKLTTNQEEDFKREGSTNTIYEEFTSSVQLRNYQAN